MPKILNENKKSVENDVAYDPADDMLKVKSTQKKFRDSFTSSVLDTTKWNLIQTGSGHTVTASSGVLTITTGTTTSTETILESVETFTIPFRAMFGFMLSQRIANQEFYFELVSVNPDTFVADDIASTAWKYDGTSATTAKYQVQNGGLSRLESGSTTVATSASYSIKEIECFSDETWFHDRAMDSTAGRSASWVRHQQIPDPNGLFKVRIRAKNLATAPASSTTLSVQYVTVVDYAELTTEITASRGASSAGMAMPVMMANSPTVIASVQANNVVGTSSTSNLAASATYTASTLDTGSAMHHSRYRTTVMHKAGDVPAHLVFEQSTDGTTFRETHRIPIPSDSQYRTYEFPINLRYVRAKVINGSTAQTAFFFGSTYCRTDGGFDFDKIVTFLHTAGNQTASATFTGATLNLGANHSFQKHRVLVYSDQAGTVYVEESRDGTTWRVTDSRAVTASTAIEFDSLIVSQYQRLRYVNGATATTAFELQSSLIRG